MKSTLEKSRNRTKARTTIDPATVDDFGSHWTSFDPKELAKFCPRPPLRLFAAGIPYLVRVATEEPVSSDGSVICAYTDWDTREIILSPKLPMIERSRTLRHEYFHAWCQQIPVPRTEEDMAIVFSVASEAFDNQINAEGGISVIYNMRPATKAGV